MARKDGGEEEREGREQVDVQSERTAGKSGEGRQG